MNGTAGTRASWGKYDWRRAKKNQLIGNLMTMSIVGTETSPAVTMNVSCLYQIAIKDNTSLQEEELAAESCALPPDLKEDIDMEVLNEKLPRLLSLANLQSSSYHRTVPLSRT